MADGSALARILDEGARRLLASDDAADGDSDEHPYAMSMAIAGEVMQLWGTSHESHASGIAYVVLMQLSDLADDPRGPQSDEMCRKAAKGFAAEWQALPGRETEAAQRAFLDERWYQDFDTQVERYS